MYPAAIQGGASLAPGVVAFVTKYGTKLAKTLGISGGPGTVLNFAKQNPTAFLLAAKETYDQGVSLFDLMVQEAPESISQLQQMVRETAALVAADPVENNTLAQLDALQDEMEAIDAAIRVLGSYDGLQTLRRVLSFSDDHFAMYLRVRRLAQSVR